MSTRPASSVRSLPSANSSGTKLARPAGFEPTTLGFGGQYSNPLSYGRVENGTRRIAGFPFPVHALAPMEGDEARFWNRGERRNSERDERATHMAFEAKIMPLPKRAKAPAP